MPKLISVKPKKFIKIFLALGFKKRDAEGSHVFFNHRAMAYFHCNGELWVLGFRSFDDNFVGHDRFVRPRE